MSSFARQLLGVDEVFVRGFVDGSLVLLGTEAAADVEEGLGGGCDGDVVVARGLDRLAPVHLDALAAGGPVQRDRNLNHPHVRPDQSPEDRRA
jgi:hypothetical protein